MRRWIGIALVILAQGWSEAYAQSRGDIELGLDGGVGLAFVDQDTYITIGFPIQNLRVGWFAGDRIEIEPSFAYQRFSSRREPPDPYFTGSESEEAGAGELALSYHGGGAESPGHMFVKGGGLVLFTENATQFGVEAGLGWKQRFADSHWALRLELAVAKTFESDELRGAWLPSLAVGFSHFSSGR